MNLRQIEVFRAIMLTGGVSDAARSLNVSQPNVSRLLRHTEDRLGIKLFDRTSAGPNQAAATGDRAARKRQ